MWVRERVREVASGDWSFALCDDEISRIRFRGADILRGVRAVARDHDWGTPVWTIGDVRVTDSGARIALETDDRGVGLSGSLTAQAVSASGISLPSDSPQPR